MELPLNPFAWGVVLMELAAGAWYVATRRPISGAMWIFYGLASVCLIMLSRREL